MLARAGSVLAVLLFLCIGGGCFKAAEPPAPYIPAPPSADINVPPNPAGAEASTGGAPVTVTPQLKTSLMVNALPSTSFQNGITADEPKEAKNPVPLPDGTRDEYITVERTYTSGEGTDEEVRYHVSISDTRGIPVLTAFVKNFNEFDSPDGYRRKVNISGTDAWILYTYDPAKNREGFGGLTMLYRDRFLIQVDATLGATEEDIVRLASAIDFTQFQ